MSDEENIAALTEKVRVLQRLVAIQSIAIMNLWGVAKANNTNNKNDLVVGWLQEVEDNLKKVTAEIVGLSNG